MTCTMCAWLADQTKRIDKNNLGAHYVQVVETLDMISESCPLLINEMIENCPFSCIFKIPFIIRIMRMPPLPSHVRTSCLTIQYRQGLMDPKPLVYILFFITP